MNENPTFARFMRPEEYAIGRGISKFTVRLWIRDRVIPFMKINRLILIDPIKADAALAKFERAGKGGAS
jgi:hypothetical protein